MPQNVSLENVLLVALGDRDPYSYWTLKEPPISAAEIPIVEAGPIVQFFHILEHEANWKYLWPSRVLLVTVHEKKKKTALRVALLKDYLKLRGVELEECPLHVEDPTDYTSLVAGIGKVCVRAETENPTARLRVLTSPGTPQMLASWLVLGNEGRLKANFFQIREGAEVRDASTDKFLHKTVGSINPVKFEALFEVEAIKSALSMFRRYDFLGASEQFKRLKSSNNDYRSAVSAYFADFCEALSNCEVFDYGPALRKLNALSPPAEVDQSVISNFANKTISRCINQIGLVQSGDPQSAALDMFCSAERLLDTQSFYNTILRCATTYEVLLTRTLTHMGLPVGEKEAIGSIQNRLLHKGEKNPDLPFPDAVHQGMSRLSLNRELESNIHRCIRWPRNQLVHSASLSAASMEKSAKKSVAVLKDVLLTYLEVEEKVIREHITSSSSFKLMAKEINSIILWQ